jgi:hypothetical protein
MLSVVNEDGTTQSGRYFVLALALFPGLGYARVWDKLIAGLPGHLRLHPSARALGELRRRLGPTPFRDLFEVLAGPLAPPAHFWSQLPALADCGLRRLQFGPGP